MRVLFAAAEMSPVARVGGLAEATGGLVRALRAEGSAHVDVVLPDYGGVSLDEEAITELEVPAWVGPAEVRSGVHPEVGALSLISTELLKRPHPYVDASGEPWPDNDARFMGFAAAAAALSDLLAPDVLHLHDWHTAAATAYATGGSPTVLTIHTLGYQGVMDASWLKRIPRHRSAFEWYGGTNPLAGGIQLADRVSTVSANYAAEIVESEFGMGLDGYLAARGSDLVGIRNGIDTEEWDPAADPRLAANYTGDDLSGKAVCRAALLDEVGWGGATRDPIIGVVSRLVHQKGIDLLLDVVAHLGTMPARLVVLGSGEPGLSAGLAAAAATHPDRLWFTNGYDVGLAHRIFAGADLLAMSSRFEPCGLAQMQAMAYGTIPVVTPVGGLVDTVADADAARNGTGFVAGGVSSSDLLDALHRGVRAVRNRRRRSAIQRRAMSSDWSWEGPAGEYLALYEDVATA